PGALQVRRHSFPSTRREHRRLRLFTAVRITPDADGSPGADTLHLSVGSLEAPTALPSRCRRLSRCPRSSSPWDPAAVGSLQAVTAFALFRRRSDHSW